jgi:hypothetical protein|tara:strand:- start:695 stop:940 length:246 start_codon:yes stop_codon:yes gene_type:complete
MLMADVNAPDWAHDLARRVESYVEDQLQQPVMVPTHTVASLPSVSRWNNCTIKVSDETGGSTLAVSNGTNWLRVSDGAVVS